MEPIKNNLEKKDWNEFRNTGLFMFINTILHAFGWALVVEVDELTGKVNGCYPARTKFRGFSETDQDEMHKRIANYLSDNGKNFPEEIK